MNTMPANVINLLKMKTVNGVTAKVFIPSNEQMSGGFDLFNDNDSRIAYNQTGAAHAYWTSSNVSNGSGYAWYMNVDGSLNSIGTNNARGFRPAVCLAL